MDCCNTSAIYRVPYDYTSYIPWQRAIKINGLLQKNVWPYKYIFVARQPRMPIKETATPNAPKRGKGRGGGRFIYPGLMGFIKEARFFLPRVFKRRTGKVF